MSELKELAVFVSYNPLDADEFVWIDTNPDKVEALLVQKPSQYKTDLTIYLVNKTPELEALYQSMAPEAFKQIDLGTMKDFNYWNCGVPRVSMIAGWRGAKLSK